MAETTKQFQAGWRDAMIMLEFWLEFGKPKPGEDAAAYRARVLAEVSRLKNPPLHTR